MSVNIKAIPGSTGNGWTINVRVGQRKYQIVIAIYRN